MTGVFPEETIMAIDQMCGGSGSIQETTEIVNKKTGKDFKREWTISKASESYIVVFVERDGQSFQ